MSTTTFCYYAEPQAVVDEPDVGRQLYIGLGEVIDGEVIEPIHADRCAIVVIEGEKATGIDLNRNELRNVIDVLMEQLGAMDAEASA